MFIPYFVHQAMRAVVEPLFDVLARRVGLPGRLPRRNEDCVWY